jgi:acid phosphatase type 7
MAQANNVDANHRISMTISFSLDYNHLECRTALPTVVYGRGFLSKYTVSAGKPLQFNYTSSVSDGLFQSNLIYHVELPNLEAGQKLYWYRIVVQQATKKYFNDTREVRESTRRLRTGSASLRLAETDTYRFKTPPLFHTPTSMALVGDLGQTENSSRTMMHIWRASMDNNNPTNRHPISHVLIAGDMSYADSDPTRWPSWLELMEPLFRSTPLHVVAGNHEIECNNETNDIFVPYENYFHNPNRVSEAEMQPVSEDYRKLLWNGSCSTPSEFQGVYNYGNSFYSYQHGLLHIIVLNSYTHSTNGSVQYLWLQQELRKYDRNKTPWLLVSFHAPLYTTFLGHVDEKEATSMKQAMEPLFIQYGVNLVLCGHDHAYMRTYSMAYGQVDPSGKSPIYLTLGTGGNREHHSSYRYGLRCAHWRTTDMEICMWPMRLMLI